MVCSTMPCESSPLGLDRASEIERDRPGVAGAAGIAERAVSDAAAAAQRLDDDADGIVTAGQHIA